MPLITVRVDEDTRNRMKRMKDVNWSEVVRSAIREKVVGAREKNNALALLLNEQIRLGPRPGYDSTKVIRKWRDTVRWKQ